MDLYRWVIVDIELPGRRKRRRPQRRFVEDVQRVGVTKESIREQGEMEQNIHCGDPLKGAAKRRSPLQG